MHIKCILLFILIANSFVNAMETKKEIKKLAEENERLLSIQINQEHVYTQYIWLKDGRTLNQTDSSTLLKKLITIETTRELIKDFSPVEAEKKSIIKSALESLRQVFCCRS